MVDESVQLDTMLSAPALRFLHVNMTVTVRPYLFITAYLQWCIHRGCSFCLLFTAQPGLTQGVSTFHVSIISGDVLKNNSPNLTRYVGGKFLPTFNGYTGVKGGNLSKATCGPKRLHIEIGVTRTTRVRWLRKSAPFPNFSFRFHKCSPVVLPGYYY